MRLDDHPTVVSVRNRTSGGQRQRVDAEWLRQACLDAGADDVGVVSLDNPTVESERAEAEQALPGAKSFVAFVVKMNRDGVRSPLRSVANLEFHHTGELVTDVAHDVVRKISEAGHRALNPAATFPHEMDRFPGKSWVIAHKLVAEAAGLGRIGIHRNVIHPRFGNFILIGVIITDVDVHADSTDGLLDFNPCLECKLCVSACPVGAITPDGGFDFQSCYTHNYREFMSGFTDWAETVADSADGADYRSRVTDSESASMWQSLAFKPNYKAAYCLAVCPAGEEVIEPWLDGRKEFRQLVVKPLQEKEETLYVLPGSFAERYATKKFPHKTVRHVSNGFPDEVNALLEAMSPHQSETAPTAEQDTRDA